MLRAILIYLSQAAWARRIVTSWRFAWRAAARFVAGETLDEAIATVRTLNAKGLYTTIDKLGEHTDSLAQATRATEDVLQILEVIQTAGVQSGVSVKLTQIGLALDQAICLENMIRILSDAKRSGIFVRIDMEDSPWVDATLAIHRSLREKGFDNVGLVIQSYLFRSAGDVVEAVGINGGTSIRLCKGAYLEPASIAYPKKSDVDTNFDRITAMLVEASLALGQPPTSQNGRTPALACIATHDEKRIAYAKEYAAQTGLSKEAIEFQMLHGIRREMQEQLASEGYPVRVYVPYGTEWYPYFTRRLAERPASLWFFVSNFFKN